MANWCNTNITINNENEDELRAFEKKLQEWTSKNYVNTDFGLNWLGNIVGNSGIDTIENGDFQNVRCRGLVSYIGEVIDGQLDIQTETAWVPMMKMWVELCEKYLPDAEIIYTAEECGNCLYETNDPYMKDHYIVDAYDIDDIESDWEASEDYVREVIQKLLHTEETDINKLMEMFYDSDVEGISIHKYNYTDINEWD